MPASEAAPDVPGRWRGNPEDFDGAARIIQDHFRRYRNRNLFKYYRDLISLKERSDPRDILRSINPREAGLIDAASGIHVRCAAAFQAVLRFP